MEDAVLCYKDKSKEKFKSSDFSLRTIQFNLEIPCTWVFGDV
jgi:hypothetical protein